MADSTSDANQVNPRNESRTWVNPEVLLTASERKGRYETQEYGGASTPATARTSGTKIQTSPKPVELCTYEPPMGILWELTEVAVPRQCMASSEKQSTLGIGWPRPHTCSDVKLFRMSRGLLAALQLLPHGWDPRADVPRS